MTEYDDEFCLKDLGIRIVCPYCSNEMVHDPDSLPLAESPTGAMLECGVCIEISQWEISGNPPVAKQVPVTFGGTV
jgi:hypothetical protein